MGLQNRSNMYALIWLSLSGVSSKMPVYLREILVLSQLSTFISFICSIRIYSRHWCAVWSIIMVSTIRIFKLFAMGFFRRINRYIDIRKYIPLPLVYLFKIKIKPKLFYMNMCMYSGIPYSHYTLSVHCTILFNLNERHVYHLHFTLSAIRVWSQIQMVSGGRTAAVWLDCDTIIGTNLTMMNGPLPKHCLPFRHPSSKTEIRWANNVHGFQLHPPDAQWENKQSKFVIQFGDRFICVIWNIITSKGTDDTMMNFNVVSCFLDVILLCVFISLMWKSDDEPRVEGQVENTYL